MGPISQNEALAVSQSVAFEHGKGVGTPMALPQAYSTLKRLKTDRIYSIDRINTA
jgi:hypothetical protein